MSNRFPRAPNFNFANAICFVLFRRGHVWSWIWTKACAIPPPPSHPTPPSSPMPPVGSSWLRLWIPAWPLKVTLLSRSALSRFSYRQVPRPDYSTHFRSSGLAFEETKRFVKPLEWSNPRKAPVESRKSGSEVHWRQK